MPGTGSGLDAQLGVVAEAAWGTPATVTRFLEFTDESMTMQPQWLEPSALRAGTKFKRASRVRQSRRTISGDLTVEHATKGMGLLWKHCLGSSILVPTQIGATTAYEQYHTPGDHRGLGLTVQVGRPEPSGVVQPSTYEGCKVVGWEFSVKDQDIPTLTVTLDGQDEKTATPLATASYLADTTVFDFSQATLKLGGTVTTGAGVTTVAGGAAIATVVTELTVAGQVPMAVERYGLGNAGVKSEPLENDIPTITGTLGAEFNKAELRDAFVQNTTQALQFTLTGAQIGSSASYLTLDIILPAIKVKAADPNVGGPDIVQMSTSFEAYSDEINPVVQVHLISGETVL